ncbi:hypothetical protein FLAV_01751 [Flavobacteriales bacterium]|nr:hypothetical protein [Flavobacteriales bacterium]CAG0980684.1 hypothetical protein FLAV_01751 [Flavobacteriales bacterium]
MTENNTETKGKVGKWLKRLGWAGFLFFFIKGLVWLAVFWGLGSFIKC